MSASVSRNGHAEALRRAAVPTVVLPDAGRADEDHDAVAHRIGRRRVEVGRRRLRAGLGDRVAAELLQHGVGEHERHHRLGDDAGRRAPRRRR